MNQYVKSQVEKIRAELNSAKAELDQIEKEAKALPNGYLRSVALSKIESQRRRIAAAEAKLNLV